MTYTQFKGLLKNVIDGGNLSERITAAQRVTTALKSLGICAPLAIPDQEKASVTADANAAYDALSQKDQLTMPRGVFVDKFVADRMEVVQKHYDAAEAAWTDKMLVAAPAVKVEHDKFVASAAKDSLTKEDAEKSEAVKKQAALDAQAKAKNAQLQQSNKVASTQAAIVSNEKVGS